MFMHSVCLSVHLPACATSSFIIQIAISFSYILQPCCYYILLAIIYASISQLFPPPPSLFFFPHGPVGNLFCVKNDFLKILTAKEINNYIVYWFICSHNVFEFTGNSLILSSKCIRRKYWIRENFRLSVFDGFICFEMSWTRFDHF